MPVAGSSLVVEASEYDQRILPYSVLALEYFQFPVSDYKRIDAQSCNHGFAAVRMLYVLYSFFPTLMAYD